MKSAIVLLFVPLILVAILLNPARADLKGDITQQINNNAALVESGMTTLSDNLLAVFAQRGLAPADTLGGGIGGFEISLDLSNVDFSSQAIEDIAGSNADSDFTVSSFPVFKLSAAVGLPVVPVDIYASYLDLGDLYSYVSLGGKYAVISGGTVVPAVSVGVNYSKTTLGNAMDTETTGFDVEVSKGFGVGVKIVPYAGIGYVSGTTQLLSDVIPAGVSIKTSYDSDAVKTYVGVSFQLTLLNIVAQVDKVGDYNAVSAKIGLRF